MIVRRGTERLVTPRKPNVRRQEILAQSVLSRAVAARCGSCGQQRIDPNELDQPQASLQGARPIPPTIRRVRGDPVLQPTQAGFGCAPIIQHVSGLSEPDEWMPT